MAPKRAKPQAKKSPTEKREGPRGSSSSTNLNAAGKGALASPPAPGTKRGRKESEVIDQNGGDGDMPASGKSKGVGKRVKRAAVRTRQARSNIGPAAAGTAESTHESAVSGATVGIDLVVVSSDANQEQTSLHESDGVQVTQKVESGGGVEKEHGHAQRSGNDGDELGGLQAAPQIAASMMSSSCSTCTSAQGRHLSEQDLGLWGKADEEGHLQIELEASNLKFLLEDRVGAEFNHRKAAFWKSDEPESKGEATVLAALDMLLAQMIPKEKELARQLRIRLCTIRMWLRRGLYLRQFANVDNSHPSVGEKCGVENAVEEVRAVVMDAINQSSSASSDGSVNGVLQRATVQQLLQALDRLKPLLADGSLAREDADMARSSATSQQSGAAHEPGQFHTQVVGNQVIVNNITSICNRQGMEQMLLSPAQGSVVIRFGAHHRIVVCQDNASAERANKIISETVQAFTKSWGDQSNNARGAGGTALENGVSGGSDLLQLWEKGTAVHDTASSTATSSRKALPGESWTAKAGGRGSKSKRVGDGVEEEQVYEDDNGVALSGQDLPHRCLDNFVLMTATRTMVELDALVSAKAMPLLLVGDLISEEQEAEQELAKVLEDATRVAVVAGEDSESQSTLLPPMLQTPKPATSDSSNLTAAEVLSENVKLGGAALARAIASSAMAGRAGCTAAQAIASNLSPASAGAGAAHHSNMALPALPQMNRAQGQLALGQFAHVLQQAAPLQQHFQQLQQLQQQMGTFGGVAGLLAQLQQRQQQQQQQQEQQLQQVLQGSVGGLTAGFSETRSVNVQLQHMEHQLQMLQQFQQLQQHQQRQKAQQQEQQQQQQQQQQQLLLMQLQQHAQNTGQQLPLGLSGASTLNHSMLGLGITAAAALSRHVSATSETIPAITAGGVAAANLSTPQQTLAPTNAGAALPSPAPSKVESACIPQIDGASESDNDMSGDTDAPRKTRTKAVDEGCASGSQSDGSISCNAPLQVAVRVEDWFLEVDDAWRSTEETASNGSQAVANGGGVLWVRGCSAWYRLKLPHAAYRRTMQAFVERVSMGDTLCELVRRSPYAGLQKVIDQLVEVTSQQSHSQSLLEAVVSSQRETWRERHTLSGKRAAAARIVPQVHACVEYLSVVIERAAKINTRVEKSRLISTLMHEAHDARSKRLVTQYSPQLRSSLMSVLEGHEKARNTPASAPGGVWRRYDKPEDDGKGIKSNQDADEAAAADMLEVAKVLTVLVSKVEMNAMRELGSGHTRRVLPVAAPLKASRGTSARSNKAAAPERNAAATAAGKSLAGKGSRSPVGSLLDDEGEGWDRSESPTGLHGSAVEALDGADAFFKAKRRSGKGNTEDVEEKVLRDSRGKSWYDHLVTLVSRQVVQEVVAQVEKIASCPPGISATNPSVTDLEICLSG